MIHRPGQRIRLNTPRPQEPVGSPARAVRLLATVLAPTGLLTGLVFYFGRLHAYWLFDHFGVPLSVMQLTAQDYLVRGEDGLFEPLVVAAAATLIALWVYWFARGRLSDRAWDRVLVWLAPVALVLGLAGAGIAVAALVNRDLFTETYAIPGTSLALGVLALVWASHLRAAHHRRRLPPALAVAEWVAAFGLISVGLFWATADYAGAVGIGRAYEVEASLPDRPDAVVYSAKSLNLRVHGVTEVRCSAPDGAFTFRYDGLKLVLQSGGQYLLLPHDWNPDGGSAIVLPRTNDLRLEFTRVPATERTC